jgi:hypothetical protein
VEDPAAWLRQQWADYDASTAQMRELIDDERWLTVDETRSLLERARRESWYGAWPAAAVA